MIIEVECALYHVDFVVDFMFPNDIVMVGSVEVHKISMPNGW